MINNEAEGLQLCTINKTYKVWLQVSYRMPLASLHERKPSDQLNTDTELPSVAYYLARHKTTGARGWMSILCILLLVYSPPTLLQNLTSTTKGPTCDSAFQLPGFWLGNAFLVSVFQFLSYATVSYLSIAHLCKCHLEK